MNQLGIGRRKLSKDLVLKEVDHRNDQFEKIARLKKYYLSRGYAVLSIDTKKKELLGPILPFRRLVFRENSEVL